MQVSVIIPCYNAAPYIAATLRSVAAQTFPAHEIIVIDDGSTDGSLAEIQNSGIPVRLLHTERALAGGARLAGVRAASGDWVAYLDADDTWYPEHLQRAQEALADSSDVAYLAHLDCMDHHTQEIFAPWTGPFLPEFAKHISSARFMERFSETWYFSPSGVLQRLDVVLAVGGPDPNPELRAREDVELFLRVIAGRTWTYDPQPGWCYRLGTPGHLSSDRMNREHAMLLALVGNEAGYPGPCMTAAIRHSARRVMAMAVTDGDAGDLQRAWETAWPRLPRLAQLFFLGWRLWPAGFRRVIELKRRIQFRKKA